MLKQFKKFHLKRRLELKLTAFVVKNLCPNFQNLAPPGKFRVGGAVISCKQCLWYCLTTADIIAEITETQDEELEDEDDNEDDKDEDKLTAKQVRSAIAVLEDLSIFSKFEEEMMASLKDLNLNIKRDYDIACKQKVITDFFSK